MRIQVNDRDGNTRTITSKNPVLIGAWMAEVIPDCMTNNPAMMKSVQLFVTPETPEEGHVFRGTDVYLTSGSLMALADHLRDLAAQMLKREIEDPFLWKSSLPATMPESRSRPTSRLRA